MDMVLSTSATTACFSVFARKNVCKVVLSVQKYAPYEVQNTDLGDLHASTMVRTMGKHGETW